MDKNIQDRLVALEIAVFGLNIFRERTIRRLTKLEPPETETLCTPKSELQSTTGPTTRL